MQRSELTRLSVVKHTEGWKRLSLLIEQAATVERPTTDSGFPPKDTATKTVGRIANRFDEFLVRFSLPCFGEELLVTFSLQSKPNVM